MRTSAIGEAAVVVACLSSAFALPEPSLLTLSTSTTSVSPTPSPVNTTDDSALPDFAAYHKLERRGHRVYRPEEYAIPPPPKNHTWCSASVQGLIDHYDVWGVNFDPAQLHFNTDDESGLGLRTQLRTYCHIYTWNFKMLENDPWGYEWHASGTAPPGNHYCIENAVKSAGAPWDYPGCFPASAEVQKDNYIRREKKRIKKEKKAKKKWQKEHKDNE